MNFSEFIKGVQSKNLPRTPLYFLTGSEDFLKGKAVQLLANYFGVDPADIKYIDQTNFSADTFLTELFSVPFFQKSEVFVLRWTTEPFPAEAIKELIGRYLKSPSPYRLLIIIAPEEIIKPATGSAEVIECAPLVELELPRWVKKESEVYGKPITDEAVQSLLQKTGPDLSAIDEALQKLTLLAGRRTTIESTDVMSLVDEDQAAEIKQLGRAIARRNTPLALNLMEQLLSQGENVEKIIGYLGAWFSREAVTDPLAAKRLKRLLKTDYLIKSGTMPPDLALRLLILRL